MMDCLVYITQYAHNGPDNSHHWSLFIEKNADTTTNAIFDLMVHVHTIQLVKQLFPDPKSMLGRFW